MLVEEIEVIWTKGNSIEGWERKKVKKKINWKCSTPAKKEREEMRRNVIDRKMKLLSLIFKNEFCERF